MNKKFAAKAQKLEVEEHKLQILKERMDIVNLDSYKPPSRTRSEGSAS